MLLNATKYTFTGEINVCVWMEDNYLLTSVEDTGIGMSELEMNSLFHMFRKLDQPKLQHGRASSLTPRPSNTSLHGIIVYIVYFVNRSGFWPNSFKTID